MLHKYTVAHLQYPNSNTHLALSGRLNVGIARVTDDIIHLLHGALRDGGERRLAVIGEVTVHLPRLPKVG